MKKQQNYRVFPLALAAFAGAALAASTATNAQSIWAAQVNGSWFDGTKWAPVGIPNSAATNVTLGLVGPYTVSMQNASATCGTLTLSNPSAVLNLFDNTQLSVTGGTISNAGLIQISGPGAPGNLTRVAAGSANTLMTGSGSLRLAAIGNGDNDSAYLTYTTAANVLTNDAGHTIAGRGRIYTNLVNNGTVNADTAATAMILLDRPKTNNATMTATNGGIMQFRSIAVTQSSSGLLLSSNNSPVQINAASVAGGTINGAGNNPGVQYFGSSSLDGVTLENLNAVQDNSLVNIDAGGVVNNGTWTVSNPAAAGNLTRIQAAAPAVTVGGTGTIRLQGLASGNGDNDSAYLTYTSAGNVLTNGATHSIRGYGRLHTNLVNDGTINADIAGKGLFFVTQPKANNGTITASNGGFVQFRSVSVIGDPTAQIISTDAASPVQIVSSTLSGGGFTTSGTGVFQYFGGSTLSNLTVNGTHQITDNSFVNLATDLVNNGTWLISNPAAAGNLTRLQAAAPAVTISGTGSIVLQGVASGNGDNTSAYLTYTSAANVLTLGSGQTVTGYGQIYTRLVNNGSMNANNSPNASGPASKGLFFLDQPKTNNGTITASNGGFVQFRSVSVTGNPAAQIISTDSASPVQIVSSTLSGGGFTTSGTGVFQYYGGSTLSNLTVNGTHQITDNSFVSLATDLVNNGTWLISNPTAAGNLTRLQPSSAAVTISGNGLIRLQGVASGNGDNTSAYLTYTAAANVLTLGSGQTLAGYGQVYTNLINNGTINADVAAKGIFLIGEPKANNGVITATNGGVVQLRGPVMTQSAGGVMSTAGTGQLHLNTGSIVGGTISTSAAGPFNAYANSTVNGVTLAAGSLCQVTDNSVLNVGVNGVVNNGRIAVQTIGAPGNLCRIIAPAAATISGTGTIDLQPVGFANDSSYLQGQGNVSNPLTLGPGQALEGSGRLYGNLVIQGTIAPDQPFGTPSSIGRFEALSGSLKMAPTSQLNIQILSTSSFDQIVGNAAITVDGGLTVTAKGAYVPAASHIFTIVSGSSLTGTFDTSNLPSGGSFGPMHVVYTPTSAKVVMCYANCDGSEAAPRLNVNDFSCFLNRYAAGDPFANCDGSTSAPILNVNDFSCFLNKYAAGCS